MKMFSLTAMIVTSLNANALGAFAAEANDACPNLQGNYACPSPTIVEQSESGGVTTYVIKSTNPQDEPMVAITDGQDHPRTESIFIITENSVCEGGKVVTHQKVSFASNPHSVMTRNIISWEKLAGGGLEMKQGTSTPVTIDCTPTNLE